MSKPLPTVSDSDLKVREAARELVPLYSPWENPQPWWGLGGMGGVEPAEGDKHRLVLLSNAPPPRRGLGNSFEADIDSLRSLAISLLVYCEAKDQR